MQRFALILVSALCGACSTTPNFDARFGDAVRQARLAQTIDPNAGAKHGQALGIDATSAMEAQKRYHDSFKAPPPVVNVINIGGAVGGGSK